MRIVSIGDLVTDFYYKNGNSVWVDFRQTLKISTGQCIIISGM